MRIRAADAADLPLLPEVERAAGRVFRDVGMPEIADDEPPPVHVLVRHLAAGLAWVSVDAADRPVAYLIAEVLDGNLHIEQVSVHPDVARRGVGRALIEHAAGYAVARGMPALTLTTFAEVPWNGPYYRRCGFRDVEDDALTPGLAAVRSREASQGLDRWPRVCLRRDL